MIQETKLREAELEPQEEPLSSAQINELKTQVFGWHVVDAEVPRLSRTFKFEDFANALLFVVQVGELAENADHHPRVTLEWGSATVEWWSHEVEGLHRNDFILAARVNNVYDRWEEIVGDKDQVQQALEGTFPASDPPPVGSRIE